MGNNINIILGTMTFGEQLFEKDVIEILRFFLNSGYDEIDTAYVYNNGKSEELIGSCLEQLPSQYVRVDTKVNPRVTGRLDGDAVRLQFLTSLKRMKTDHADILYLHFPDKNTPIESALKVCAELFGQGKFRELGLSNFPAWMVSYVYHTCKENGWVCPTVYEGLYNPLSRRAEQELNEALNKYNIRFHAYNPLAGGMLTNKYSKYEDKPETGRFIFRPNYQNRYWKQSYFQAVDVIKEACKKEGIDIVAAVFRWLAYHSMLTEMRGDGIIMGFSRLSQLQQNLSTLQQGELPDSILTAFSDAWEICKNDSPNYFKYYQGQEEVKCL